MRRAWIFPAACAAALACGTRTSGGPRVVSTDPADGASGVAPTTAIRVVFDAAMLASTVSGVLSGTTCDGSLQLSRDAFSTCVAFSGAPVASGGGFAFTAVPAVPLLPGSIYRIRVRPPASGVDGRVLGREFVMPNGFTVGTPAPTPTPSTTPWSHTITIDGTNDFSQADEKFSTSSTLVDASYHDWITWDSSNLYLGFGGADVASASATKWAIAYIGGPLGSTAGQTYGASQSPTLPFPAQWHFRWKASNDFSSLQTNTSGNWVEAPFDVAGHVFKSGQFVEISIPLSAIGHPAQIPIVLDMLNEQGGAEATYAGVPPDAFTDGLDPNFAHFYDFVLGSALAPNLTPEQ